MIPKGWFVYILECRDGTLYTGITTNLERRIKQHKAGTGARYTKARGVKKVLWTTKEVSRADASSREAKIKKLSRKQKQALIARHRD